VAQIRVAGQHTKAELEQLGAQALPDPAHTDQTDGFAGRPDALKIARLAKIARRRVAAHTAKVAPAREQHLAERQLGGRDGIDGPSRDQHDVALDERPRKSLHVAGRIEDGSQSRQRGELLIVQAGHTPGREDHLHACELRNMLLEARGRDDVWVKLHQPGDALASPAAENIAVARRVVVEKSSFAHAAEARL
jgi:hypothetical protein